MVKILLLVFMLTWPYASTWADNSSQAIARRCPAPLENEPVLYLGDFRWNYSQAEMMKRFEEIYRSQKRLAKRAYWHRDKQTLVLPYDESRGGEIEITSAFVQSVASHIERALEFKYAEAVFFPDMGHSHLLIPDPLWEKKYSGFPQTEFSRLYEELYRDPEIKILYHTAEQLHRLDENRSVIDDPHIRWRQQTRNIVGKNSPRTELQVLVSPQNPDNRIDSVEGHFWWGSGFNLSANENGCFEFRNPDGNVMRFDISAYDLPSDPAAGGASDYF